MNCDNCGKERIASINAKCSDMCFAEVGGNESDGYVPRDMGIGGGDYVDFNYCLDCGKIQGQFPLEETGLESENEHEDGDEELETDETW